MSAAAAFVRQIDKLPLPVKSAPGFLVNRILAPYMMAAFRAVDEGIAPETVDEAALAFGMPMGPIELADTVGLDIAVAVGKLLGGRDAPPRKLSELVEAGHVGKKSGRGFYAWTNGKPVKQPAGAVPAGLADRLVQPFVAEAKAALAEGIVDDADLVDAGAIFGTGFAPFRGGPLHYASTPPRTPGGRGRGAGAGGVGFAGATREIRDRAGRNRRDEPLAHDEADVPSRPRTSFRRRDRGKGLAQSLSERHSPYDRRDRVRVGARGLRGGLRQVRGAAGVHLHGQDDDVRRARHAVVGVRCVAAGERVQEGHARRAS